MTAPTVKVILDYSDFVESEYVDHTSTLANDARAELTDKARPCERIIVLTEESSDTRILKTSLDLFPYLSELYSFLDHQTFSVQGGASTVLSIAKAMAGAGVANRVVGLLDNDTAGTIALRNAARLNLPPNIRLLQLPPLEHAKAYPTLGPNGLVNADINLCACGIEMYCGLEALRTDEGALMPVQWTGYEKSLQRYQGELLDKEAVQKRFFEHLAIAVNLQRDELNPIRAVLQTIFNAFA